MSGITNGTFMGNRNFILLSITVILLIVSTLILVAVGVENVIDFILLTILFLDITCFPCAYCYHYDKSRNGKQNLIDMFPARSGLLILLFTSPYFLILYIVSVCKH